MTRGWPMVAVLWALSAAPAEAVPGPPLTEPADALRASLDCERDLDRPGAPVLLVHGTFGDASYWDGNFRQALARDGHGVCAVTTPGRQFIDAQRSVEYVVHGLRELWRRTTRPVAVIGHSQGALLPTLALRFWPDLAHKVDDFVGLAGVYENGDATAAGACAIACPPSGWQISPGSRFLRGYAAKPLYRGPDYTSLATAYDVFVTPQPQASALRGARNITLQDVCAGRVVEHLAIAADALAYALSLDALAHRGPADPARIGKEVCGRQYIEGSRPERISNTALGAVAELPRFADGHRDGEPALRCHLDPGCPKPRLRPQLRVRAERRRVSGRLVLPRNALDQCEGAVTVRAPGRRRTVPLTVACTFRTRMPGRRVSVRFPGSRELLPTTARGEP